METTDIFLLVAAAGILVASLAYTVARANAILKAIGLIGLIAGAVMIVVGCAGYLGAKDGVPVGLGLGALITVSQPLAQRQLGIRGQNKPTIIKRAYKLVGIAMALGLVVCAIFF